tara:strand:- start:234 stop:977 length:744 start_codon:yes stop_codon:yes gene_type:complete
MDASTQDRLREQRLQRLKIKAATEALDEVSKTLVNNSWISDSPTGVGETAVSMRFEVIPSNNVSDPQKFSVLKGKDKIEGMWLEETDHDGKKYYIFKTNDNLGKDAYVKKVASEIGHHLKQDDVDHLENLKEKSLQMISQAEQVYAKAQQDYDTASETMTKMQEFHNHSPYKSIPLDGNTLYYFYMKAGYNHLNWNDVDTWNISRSGGGKRRRRRKSTKRKSTKRRRVSKRKVTKRRKNKKTRRRRR